MLRVGSQGQDERMKVKGHRPEGSHFPSFKPSQESQVSTPSSFPMRKGRGEKEASGQP